MISSCSINTFDIFSILACYKNGIFRWKIQGNNCFYMNFLASFYNIFILCENAFLQWCTMAIVYGLTGLVFCCWIGLHLFNDDTCAAWHISRPTQVGVSLLPTTYQQTSKSGYIIQFLVARSSSNLHHLWTDWNEELHGIFSGLYQMEGFGFS